MCFGSGVSVLKSKYGTLVLKEAGGLMVLFYPYSIKEYNVTL